MDGSESLLKAYQYTSFRNFGLTIRNKLKMSKHAYLHYAPKFQAIICKEQLHWKQPL